MAFHDQWLVTIWTKMTLSVRAPVRGAPLSRDVRMNCTTGKRQFLGWVRSPILILQFLATEANPSCMVDCPAGAADWARGRGSSTRNASRNVRASNEMVWYQADTDGIEDEKPQFLTGQSAGKTSQGRFKTRVAKIMHYHHVKADHDPIYVWDLMPVQATGK